jgi:hypothetical protein
MFKLMKWVIFGAFVAGFIWFGSNVNLGKHTLFGHVQRIWKSEETQDLVEGTKEAAGPTVEKVKRGVKAGVDEARKPGPDDQKGAAGEASESEDKAPDLKDAPPPKPSERVSPRKRNGRRAQR